MTNHLRKDELYLEAHLIPVKKKEKFTIDSSEYIKISIDKKNKFLQKKIRLNLHKKLLLTNDRVFKYYLYFHLYFEIKFSKDF